MHYTLNLNESEDFLRVFVDSVALGEIESAELANLFDQCKDWTLELIGSNYFFALCIEKRKKIGKSVGKEFIERIYQVQNDSFFCLQEVDLPFLNRLFTHPIQKGISRHDFIVEVSNKLREKGHGKPFCC